LSRGSALYRDGLRPVDDDTSAEMLESGRDLLGQHGLLQYEVSNYARPPHHSHHNLSCWRGNPYLGIGAAAHSLLVDGDCNWRMINPPFSRYLGASASESHPRRMVGTRTFRSDRTTAQFEWMLLGLRTVEGVDRQAFSRRFACDPGARYAAPLSRLRNMDLIEINRTHIRPTARGIWFADELAHRLDG
jgi:oxygen-independent coproporphyrinogen-3 oxidase